MFVLLLFQDIATLIVERATLINHLLPSEASTSERADLVLSAMVDLFYNYLLKAQQDQDQGYVWVSVKKICVVPLGRMSWSVEINGIIK